MAEVYMAIFAWGNDIISKDYKGKGFLKIA
jgi:hypothetical protein